MAKIIIGKPVKLGESGYKPPRMASPQLQFSREFRLITSKIEVQKAAEASISVFRI